MDAESHSGIVLRAGAKLVRDVFITEDKTLVLRQTKFTDDGQHVETKMFRLEEEEVQAVLKLWGEQVDGK
jgi:hypothetical protein